MTRIASTNPSNRIWFCGLAVGAASALLACGGPVPYGTSQIGGAGANGGGGINLSTNGAGAGSGTSTGAGGGDGCSNDVQAVVRDFRGWASSASDPGGAAPKHPDFEPNIILAETGIAASTLGADQKPVFANTAGIQTVQSADTFAQWYRDVDGVNMRFPVTLPLTADSTAAAWSTTTRPTSRSTTKAGATKARPTTIPLPPRSTRPSPTRAAKPSRSSATMMCSCT